MKRFWLSFIICSFIISIGNCGECKVKKTKTPKQAKAPQIVVSDFRNANKLDTFYYYDKKKKEYVFVPVSFKNYIKLTKENKKIYREVKSAQRLMTLSQNAPFKTVRMNTGQTAFQKNPDLIPAAYNMSEEFQKDKKYSTALYYAQKVQNNDKKNRFKDITVKTGELKYLLGNYDEAVKDLNTYINSPEAKSEEKVKAYTILSDITLKTADAKNPNAAYKQALIYADRALSMDGRNVSALESKYTSCFGLKSYVSALDSAQKLMNLDSKNASYKLKYEECEKALKK